MGRWLLLRTGLIGTRRSRRSHLWSVLALSVGLTGCGKIESRDVVRLWHQMVPAERAFLVEEIAHFEKANPTIRIEALYKETEELRSGFQAAVLAGAGPELVFGPSDSMGPYQAMGLLQDMSPWLSAAEQEQFLPQAFVWLPRKKDRAQQDMVMVGDRFGNHLALVYNQDFIKSPPTTIDELIRVAVENTLDENGDGKFDRYGLVWNFTEPFFAIPFLTGYGGWVLSPDNTPTLDTPQMIEGLRMIARLQQEYGVIPAGCDYEQADSLFKMGKAAMIINGDWSWGDYLKHDKIHAAIAPLPDVPSTGKAMRPMSAPKGYSLSILAAGNARENAMRFMRYMLSEDVQRRSLYALRVVPSRRSLQNDPIFQDDPTLSASRRQIERSEAMPVVAELRAVWDGMRPGYQALLGGNATAEEAAKRMQKESETLILRMRSAPDVSRNAKWILPATLAVTILGYAWLRRDRFAMLPKDMARQPLPYFFILPSLLVIAFAVLFPFFYNVALSFSNMSLTKFQDWELIGWQNYRDALATPKIWIVILKTIAWTAINVFFHVAIGLMLAIALDGVHWGKSIYRVLLIIPWAVPAYITALTWRGMFDNEFGIIPQTLQTWGFPQVNWLKDTWGAFIACLVTNIWLGFPFMMIITLGGLQGIPRELYEAASIDRASRWHQFWHITLPMLRPVLVPAVTLGTIWTFNNLNVVWLVSNGGEPSDSTHILVSYVYKAVFNLYQFGYGAALSLLIFGMILGLSWTMMASTRATEGTS
jgi:arabinogalactan oligomer / maltooligosaccharide transport system permease protein